MLQRTALLLVLAAGCLAQSSFRPEIPKIWDDREIAAMEIPVADPQYSPRHVKAEYYYRIPVRPIYRGYPIYAPGRAPAGYMDALRQKEPEILFDASRLHAPQDWKHAGEVVFDAATGYEDPFKLEDVSDPKWWSEVTPPLDRDGALAGLSYVIRQKGKIEVGGLSCGTCHTRVMADGTIVKGGQGNFPFDRALAWRNWRAHGRRYRPASWLAIARAYSIRLRFPICSACASGNIWINQD